MAHYVLHFPNENNAAPALLERHGLQSLAENCSYSVDRGEGGRQGVMLSWFGIDDMPGPTVQRTWTQLPGKECWMGVEIGRPVTPKDLARKAQTPGYVLPLADGKQWHCPALRNVSHVHKLNGLGQYERTVAPEYTDLWDMSQEYAGQFFQAVDMLDAAKRNGINSPTHVDFTCEESFAFCCQCLALNYRVTPEIVSVLGLIDDDAMRNIIKSAIDLPVLLDFSEKKKAPSSSPLADGAGLGQGAAA
jgi:hypothetical protein